MTWTTFKAQVSAFFASSGVSILEGIILFVIGYFVIQLLLKLTTRVLARAKIEKSARKFLYNLVKYLLYLLLIMIIASSLGISITGFVAVLSAAGLAISLALQSSLSNLANGIVIIITKPFKENDMVTVQGYDGFIKEIHLTYTVLTGLDNKQINIPNKVIVESVLVNGSVNEVKKITYNFLVSYASDVEKVKDIILHSFAKTNYVLTDPKPMVVLNELKDNGITFKAQCTVESKHYGVAYHALLEDIFNEFKKQHIVMPYAQMEVRIRDDKETLPFYHQSKLTNKPEEPMAKQPEKPYEHTIAEELVEEAKPVKEEVKPEPTRDYLEYVVEDEVEVVSDEEEQTEPEEVKPDEVEEEPKEGFASKFFKRNPKDKKPTVIIKKK